LHALDRLAVLGKHGLPQFAVGGAVGLEVGCSRAVVEIENLETFFRASGAVRLIASCG